MAEVITGRVHNGVVVFEGIPPLAEGTRVAMTPIVTPTGPYHETDPMARTRAWLLAAAVEAEDDPTALPSDMAENHDRYAHGRPRS